MKPGSARCFTFSAMITMHFTVELMMRFIFMELGLHCMLVFKSVLKPSRRSLVYYEVKLKSDEVAFVP